jgi:hypothetical protein
MTIVHHLLWECNILAEHYLFVDQMQKEKIAHKDFLGPGISLYITTS